MRRLFAILAVAGMSLLGAASAHAGTLQSATLQITAYGAVFNVSASGAVGSSTATSATLASGSAFATSLSVHAGTAVTDSLHLGGNGRLTATSGGVAATGPVTGTLTVYEFNKALTVAVVPILAGGGSYIFTGYPALTVTADSWRVGQAQVASSGITHVILPNTAGTAASTAAQTHLTATGSFNLTPGGGGTVTLVSITHVTTSVSNIAYPTYLTLTYVVPEPGTLLLLAAGVGGLLLTGRGKTRT